MTKNNNFDFLRFFFAFIVVVGHTVILSNSKELSCLLPFFDTHIAVTGFFVISGLLIANSYLRTSIFRQYLIKRALRLLPNYIFIVILCAVVFSLISTLSLYDYLTNTRLYYYLLANLSFMNFLQPSLPGVFEGTNNVMSAVNGSLWTIKVEVMFYMIVPLVLKLIESVKSKKILRMIIFVLIYILSIIYRVYFEELAQQGSSIASVLVHQLPAFMCYFISGIALLYYGEDIEKHIKLLAIISLGIYVIEYILDLEYLSPVAFALIIYYVALHFKFLNNFGKYGDFSYGIYIFHFPLIQLYVFFGLFNVLNPWLMLIFVLFSVMIMALFSWNLIEKPFLLVKQKK